MFTYTTTGTPTYLRLLTLDNFDGTVWSVSSVTSPDDTKIYNEGIPPPAGVTLHPTGTATTNVVDHRPSAGVPAGALDRDRGDSAW